MPSAPVIKKDVVVIGGGAAGICAAIAAARNGADTLLVEQRGFLGGAATYGLPLLGFHDFQDQQIVKGIAQEIVDELIALGGCTGHIPTPETHHPTYCLIDPEAMKYVALKLVTEAGAERLLHTFAVDVVVQNDVLRGVVVASKSGIQQVRSKIVVDASGDADIAARAGVPCEKGDPETGLMQAMTLEFRMGNVDLDAVIGHINEGLVMTTWPGEERPRLLRAQGDFTPWAEAVKREGLFDDPRHKIWVNSFRPGEVNINTTRIVGYDGSDAWDLSRAEIEGREQMMAVVRFLQKYVPGFESSYLISSASQIGVRETRRIVGKYTLTEDDVISGRRFDDGVACGAYPIDIHDPTGERWLVRYVKDGGYYQIPYRCTLPCDIGGILVAGRCISTTHGAQGSTRVMATCMAVGHAVGLAAAMAAARDGLPQNVDVRHLQERLITEGAFLGV